MHVPTLDSLDGQVALVTGASRGIGERVATDLVDLDATVYGTARDPTDVDAAGVRALGLEATDEDAIEETVAQVRADAGRLDVLVNNAGVIGPASPLDRCSTDEWDRTLATNLRGPALLAKYALPSLLDGDGGRVVNVSSGMGALGESMGGGYPAYRVSKTALNGLTRYLDGEYGRQGLLANAVCPGWVRTDMGGPGASRSVAEGADTVVWCSRFAPGAPAGHFWRDRTRIEW